MAHSVHIIINILSYKFYNSRKNVLYFILLCIFLYFYHMICYSYLCYRKKVSTVIRFPRQNSIIVKRKCISFTLFFLVFLWCDLLLAPMLEEKQVSAVIRSLPRARITATSCQCQRWKCIQYRIAQTEI